MAPWLGLSRLNYDSQPDGQILRVATIEDLNPGLKGLGTYEYGWADSDTAGATAKRGLNEAVTWSFIAKEKAEADRTNGSRGGNPRLRDVGKPATETGGLTPGDKAQRPEARDQRLEARDQREGGAGAPPPPSPDRVPRGSLVPIDAPGTDLLAIPPQLERRRAARLPAEWMLPEDWRHRAIDARERHGLPPINLDLEAEKFANYWHAQPGAKGTKLDWAATWQNWALRADGLGRGGVNGAPQMDDAALERELDRRMGGR